jgi:phosphoribosyl 1,2-cyclic phosphodiesterase
MLGYARITRPTMTTPVASLRIHVYGTQGSGSVFPSREERQAIRRRSEVALLERVFADLTAHADGAGRIDARVEDILGGPVSLQTLRAYADRFDVPEPRVYGGWTTCVRLETADGHDIVFDCGSGFRNCAHDLQAKWGPRSERHLHLFGSHSHLDHTEGFDQAAVCFDPRNHLHIYGNHQFLRALDFHLGIFSRQVASSVQGVQTPIFYGVMPARFQAWVIGEPPTDSTGPSLHASVQPLDEPIRLGGTTITAFEVFHPAPCLGYRVEHAGRVFVFCTDHELWHGAPDSDAYARSRDAEARVVAHATGADLLYRDGQYLRAEYDGLMGIGGSGAIPRAGWGHSCIEDVIEMAVACRVRRTLIGHHDPNRDWSERNWLDESMLRRTSQVDAQFEFARAETVIDL